MAIVANHTNPPDRASRAATPAPQNGSVDELEREHGFKRQEAARIVLVVIAAAAVWLEIWEPVPGISLIGVVGLLVGGWPILKEAFENLLARRMTMELSGIMEQAHQTRSYP